MSRTISEQLTHFVSDMYSVEQQALAQLRTAPDMAGDPGFAQDLSTHNSETERHADLMLECLEAHGGSRSAIKDAVIKLGGKGFLLFAKLMPETPGRLAAHAYAYEAMEWAGYEMLKRFAMEAGDSRTLTAAERIRDEERTMMERIERRFDAVEEVSHESLAPEKRGADLRTHIAEAHALESQGIQLLGRAKEIAGAQDLARVCEENLLKSREHSRLLDERLADLADSPSDVKDAALGLGGLNWAFFFQAQADTAAKLAAFAYAFEHLKIAGYELLLRTARRAHDTQTVVLCKKLLAEERAMVEALAATFDDAARATLAEVAA